MMLNTGEELVCSEAGLLTTDRYRFTGNKPVYALDGLIPVTGSAVQWWRDQFRITRGASQSALGRQGQDNGGMNAVPAFSGPVRAALALERPGGHRRAVALPHQRPPGAGHTGAIDHQSRDVVEAMTEPSGVTLDVLTVDGGVTADFVHAEAGRQIGVPGSRPVVALTTALGAAYAAGLASSSGRNSTSCTRTGVRPSAGRPAARKRLRRGKKTVKCTFDWIDVQ